MNEMIIFTIKLSLWIAVASLCAYVVARLVKKVVTSFVGLFH